MGIVYRARAADGRPVAVKLLNALEAAPRFERERSLLASLGPASGFVPVLDSGTSPRGPWFAMPLMAGTLREKLARGPLSLAETVALGRRLASSLAHAHARGIVHRDLKPENVLQDERGTSFIADLGIAKSVHATAGLTASGVIAGTIGYMAPEQLNDARSVTPAADVHSLGAILYECLSGKRPWGDEGTLTAINRMKAHDLVPLRRVRPETPVWLAAAIGRALAFDPGERWADGRAFAEALSERGGRRRPVGLALALGALPPIGVAVLLLARGSVSPPAPPPSPPAPAPSASPPAERSRPTPPVGATNAVEGLLAEIPGYVTTRALERALAAAARARELAPGDPRVWLASARARIARHEGKAALDDLARALELDPRSADAYAERALAHAELWLLGEAQYERSAIADAARAIELAPALPAALYARAIAPAPGDDPIAVATRAIESDPDSARVHVVRAQRHMARGDAPRCAADVSRALAIDPQCPEAHVLAAMIAHSRSDTRVALAHCDRAVRVDPGLAAAWRTRAAVLFSTGMFDAAERDIKGAMSCGDRGPGVLTIDAQLRIRRRDFAGALDDADRVIAFGRERAGALIFGTRAASLEKLGRLAEAADAFRDAATFERDPSYKSKWEANERRLREALAPR